MGWTYTAPENARVSLMFNDNGGLRGYSLTINNETFEVVYEL